MTMESISGPEQLVPGTILMSEASIERERRNEHGWYRYIVKSFNPVNQCVYVQTESSYGNGNVQGYTWSSFIGFKVIIPSLEYKPDQQGDTDEDL